MASFQKWKPYILILSVYFVLAVLNILFKKVVDVGENMLAMVTYRLTIAGIFLAPIAYFLERKNGISLTTPILLQLFISALLGATINQYLFLLGLHYTSAAFGTAFSNVTPVFEAFLLAVLLGQERVNLRTKGGMAKVLGPLICTSGVIVLMFYTGVPLNKATTSSHTASNSGVMSKGGSAKRWIVGSMFLVISQLCWAIWFILQGRFSKIFPSKYTNTIVLSLFGALQSGILCFATTRNIGVWVLKGKLLIITVLSAGIFGSGLCYAGMTWCVEQRGPVFTAAFIPFIQIFIIILDLTIFHEQIYLGSVIGSIVVICGLYTLLWGKSRDAKEELTTKQVEVETSNGISSTTSNVTAVSPNLRCPA